MTTAVELDREQWFDDYNRLDPAEQYVLQLMSVYYEPINKTSLFQLLRSLRARDATRRMFTLKSLSQLLKDLEQRGFVQKSHGAYRCPALCLEELTLRATEDGLLSSFINAIKPSYNARSGRRWYGYHVTSFADVWREWRVTVYQRDWNEARSQLERMRWLYREEFDKQHPYTRLLRNVYDLDWFLSLDESFLQESLSTSLGLSFWRMEPADEVLGLLESYCEEKPDTWTGTLCMVMGMQWLFRGYISGLREFFSTRPDAHEIWACIELLAGNLETSEKHFTQALEAIQNQDRRKRKPYLEGISGVFRALALIQQGELQQAHDWITYVEDKCTDWLQNIYKILKEVTALQLGRTGSRPSAIVQGLFCREPGHEWERLIRWFTAYWLDKEAALPHRDELEQFYHRAHKGGYYWIQAEAAELLARLDDSETSRTYRQIADRLWDELQAQSLIEALKPKPVWEHMLQALLSVAQAELPPAPNEEPQHRDERLVWFVGKSGKSFTLEGRVQKWSIKGHWTKGRKIPVYRLENDIEVIEGTTTQDKEVGEILRLAAGYTYSYSGYTYHKQNPDEIEAFAKLVGHPLVFWEDNPLKRIDVSEAEPILRVAHREGDQLHLQLEPKYPKDNDIIVQQVSPTRLEVIKFTEQHQKLAEVLGDSGLVLPLAAQQRVLDVVGTIAPLITIHSDIGGSTIEAEEVKADSRPYLYLYPYREGLRVELVAKPFGDEGPRFLPGKGATSVFARLEDKTLHTERDLAQEEANATSLLEASPILLEQPETSGEWVLQEPEMCLELLLQLKSFGDNVVMCWPEGEKFRIREQVSTDMMRWNISGAGEWFQASGKLQVDSDLVLELQNLLYLLELSPGRFVQLEDGQFLALTEEFRQRLDDFRAFSSANGKGSKFHASAAFAMEDVFEGASVRSNKHWKEHCERLHSTTNQIFTLPTELTADLREYQQEGYQWLSRLSHWRFGACLADEMGLGKTLQALAVLQARAEDGPSLVIAPTSVCYNWADEVAKFAPNLNVRHFGSSERQELLDSLEPYDLVICSYGLLPYEIDKLSQVQWNTVVLDEAQAIKNFATKRSKAAMQLMSDFKIITTGTPIENHLGELWNLFRFLNPGLLGNWQNFQSNFANAIEREQSNETRDRLKRLIQPFILRRRKQQVLKELPPRTETILHVELSRKEKALYEALRQKAMDNLTANSDAPTGQRHLQILAELTKLRQACCNPRLILPDSDVESSKLQMLEELLDELLANEHKVLVFSQFVKHLALIREKLDQKGISYQYLDGQTPQRQRKQRIDAFQAGEGDVFLISLKAGGTGINLTAADYVIHMDPWWNPAVEDQASDRAHRIGQDRPVTIYRLVTQHTVEEKIVQLHDKKRDLAESLLEGSDMTGKMSADELIALIREG